MLPSGFFFFFFFSRVDSSEVCLSLVTAAAWVRLPALACGKVVPYKSYKYTQSLQGLSMFPYPFKNSRNSVSGISDQHAYMYPVNIGKADTKYL